MKFTSGPKPALSVQHSAISEHIHREEDDDTGGEKLSEGGQVRSLEKGYFQSLSFRNLPECFGDTCHSDNDAFVRGINEPYYRCGSLSSKKITTKPPDLKSTKGTQNFIDFIKEPPNRKTMVTEVVIRGDESDRFHVLIDGITHGPFRKISIVPNDVS